MEEKEGLLLIVECQVLSGKFGENAAGVGRSAVCNHHSQDLTRQWDF